MDQIDLSEIDRRLRREKAQSGQVALVAGREAAEEVQRRQDGMWQRLREMPHINLMPWIFFPRHRITSPCARKRPDVMCRRQCEKDDSIHQERMLLIMRLCTSN